jgi:C4-dicarboxylate transporter DctQ subunit
MTNTGGSSILGALAAAHDAVSRAGFAIAALLVAVIAASFCYEVLVRYFFDAPTAWSYDLGSYLLCATIFLTIPELTRRNAHVTINLLAERLSARQARLLGIGVGLLAAAACLIATWITGGETWRQFEQGVSTLSAVSIPKWWVSVFIPYGLASSALHFLRGLGRPPEQGLPIDGAAA